MKFEGRMDGFFPYGVQYYRPPSPPKKERTKDLRQIKELGFNIIKIQPQWNWTNPKENVFDFEETKELLDLAQKNGIKVAITTILENAPYWLAKKYPEARYTSFGGEVVDLQSACGTPSGGWPGLCLDHPGVRKAARKWLEAITREFRKHPALYIWHVWEEPHMEANSYYEMSPFPANLFCCCSSSMDKFRNWLKLKHKSIFSLNEHWHTKYSDWEEITPPARPCGGYSLLMDWLKFSEESLAEIMSFRVETIRGVDNGHLIISNSGLNTLDCGKDNWLLAKHVDEWALSLFPRFGNQCEPLCSIGRTIEALISSAKGKTCLVFELQAGGGSWGKGIFRGVPPAPKEIAAWVWSSIAYGMKGILYWCYRPETTGTESPGIAMCDLEGNLTERAETAKKLGQIINRYPVFKKGKPSLSEAGILHNRERVNLLRCALEDNRFLSRSVTGIYQALWDKNLTVRFVHLDETSLQEMKKFKILYFPFPLSLTNEQAEKVKQYVYSGGILVSECHTAQYNEYGYCSQIVPGNGLDEVFGCIRKDVGHSIEEEKIIMSDGRKVTAKGYREVYKLTKGKIKGKYSDGAIAVVENIYGKGRAVLFGTLVFESKENSSVLTRLLPEDIKPEIKVSPDIFARTLTYQKEMAIILINTRRSITEVKIFLRDRRFTINPKEIWQGKQIKKRRDYLSLTLEPLESAVLYMI